MASKKPTKPKSRAGSKPRSRTKRKAKPTPKTQGTQEAAPTPGAGAPPTPGELSGGPAAVWEAFAPRLVELGRTKPPDLLTFEVFCRERHRWQQCEAMSADAPIVKVAGVLKAHPALQQAQKAREAWLSAGRVLGLVAPGAAAPKAPPPPPPNPGGQPDAKDAPQGLKLTEGKDTDGWSDYIAGEGA